MKLGIVLGYSFRRKESISHIFGDLYENVFDRFNSNAVTKCRNFAREGFSLVELSVARIIRHKHPHGYPYEYPYVNGQRVRKSIRILSPRGHLQGYPHGYPCGCPCRITRATDSSTRGKSGVNRAWEK